MWMNLGFYKFQFGLQFLFFKFLGNKVPFIPIFGQLDKCSQSYYRIDTKDYF